MTDGFDLTSEPWLPLHMLDGEVREVSLMDAFIHAGDARGIAGELPTMTFALLRLLLAILHRAVDGPRDDEEWTTLWEDPSLATNAVTVYLDAHRGRFDLLSPTTPFFQVADLRTGRDGASGLEALIADVPNNIRMFPTRHGSSLAAISLAEAARWVVHAQAFEPSGIRGAAVGDPRARSGKVYPIGTGWTGAIGGVYFEGDTLRDTLLFNLVRTEPDDVAVWERSPQSAFEEVRGGRAATGPVDAYTWQKARIRLVVTDDRVTGVVIGNGDRAVLANRMNAEPMTAWRRSENQEKATGITPVYLPARHYPSRAFWRGIGNVLPAQTAAGSRGTAPGLRPPGVVDWMQRLSPHTFLDRQARLHAVGMEYGSQNAVVNDLVDDTLAIELALLRDENRELAAAAVEAADTAGKACWALGTLAGNVTRAQVGDDAGDAGKAHIDSSANDARAIGFTALDAPYRAWLSRLKSGDDAAEHRRHWVAEVRRQVLTIAERISTAAPPQAMVTRPPSHTMSVPLAELQFLRYLAKENIMPSKESPDDQF